MGEHYIPTEIYGIETKKPDKKEKSLWKRITNIKEAVAFATLLATLAPNVAEARKQADTGPRKPEITEVGENDASEYVQAVAERLKEAAKRGIGFEGIMERTRIRKFATKSGHTVETGYNSMGDEGKPVWIFDETGDGIFRQVDLDADGFIDRLIVNKSQGSARIRSAENDMYMFQAMGDLAREASTVADLHPEDVTIFSIERSDRSTTMRDVEFQGGGTAQLEGTEADSLAKKMQTRFRDRLGECATELDQL